MLEVTRKQVSARGDKWTRPLRVLAAQRQLHTSASTRPQNVHTAVGILYNWAGTCSPSP